MFIIYDPKDRVSELAARILQFTHRTAGDSPDGVDIIDSISFLTAVTDSSLVCDASKPRSIYLTTLSPELYRKIRKYRRAINGLYLRKAQAETTSTEGIAWISDIAELFKLSPQNRLLTYGDGMALTVTRKIRVELNSADTLLVKTELGVDLDALDGVSLKPRVIPE